MAMWFAHVHYAEETRRNLPELGLDPLDFAWGALAGDVDKVSAVPRERSHFYGVPREVEPEALLEAAGADPADLPDATSFLAGYACHITVDSAWYRFFHKLGQDRPDLGAPWEAATTRALNLALDVALRAALDPSWIRLEAAKGERVLPFLRGAPAVALRRAAGMYLRWGGDLAVVPPDEEFRPWVDRFRAIAAAEAHRVQAIRDAFVQADLDAAVLDRAIPATRRFVGRLAALVAEGGA